MRLSFFYIGYIPVWCDRRLIACFWLSRHDRNPELIDEYDLMWQCNLKHLDHSVFLLQITNASSIVGLWQTSAEILVYGNDVLCARHGRIINNDWREANAFSLKRCFCPLNEAFKPHNYCYIKRFYFLFNELRRSDPDVFSDVFWCFLRRSDPDVFSTLMFGK